MLHAMELPYLSEEDRAKLGGASGPAVASAMRIIVSLAEILGARDLVTIRSAHIDGCLYHGDSGVFFAEHMVHGGAQVVVPTSLNVGALDLGRPGSVRLGEHQVSMARRMANAYVAMGCKPTWTCAPYQAGHRPACGEDVAWGESNAVAFANSVLGARTNRYGDFLDLCAALTGRAPRVGLHLPEARLATVLVDTTSLPTSFSTSDIVFPILGNWLGRFIGSAVAAFRGLRHPTEDQLKALGAAAASSGSVGLFHVIGATPEAPTLEDAFGGSCPQRTVYLDMEMLAAARASMSTIEHRADMKIDAVAIGSPHLSANELRSIGSLLSNRPCGVPLYACTSRHSLSIVAAEGFLEHLEALGVVLVADTCIVIAPILPHARGVLVTNSGKFAHYVPSNTGYAVVFASLVDCVESAVRGRLVVSNAEWQ
jgi:predicted aconitase